MPYWCDIPKIGNPTFVLLKFASMFATKLDQTHASFCCVCCWARFMTERYTKNRKPNVAVTKCCFYIYNLQLNWVRCTPCFAVCGAGLSALLMHYTKQGKLPFVLLEFASIFETELDQIHALFCCVCGWARFLTGTRYKN